MIGAGIADAWGGNNDWSGIGDAWGVETMIGAGIGDAGGVERWAIFSVH